MKIKRIGVLSLGKILATLYALIGLILGAFFTFFSILGLVFYTGQPNAALFLGIASIILFPIAYGIAGFVGGVIIAFLYNIVAAWVGGVELEIENTKNP